MTIIPQDKSSCLPIYLMRKFIKKDDHCIDATAAPGNKTLQLSELSSKCSDDNLILDNVTSVEIDERRFISLVKRVKKAGAEDIVNWKNEDFL